MSTPAPGGRLFGAKLASLTNAELTDGIGQLAAIEGFIHRRRLELVAEYDRRRAWKEDGATSMVTWLCGFLAESFPAARDDVRMAHTLPDLPHIDSAYNEGRLSTDQVRAVTQFATPETDEDLAKEAEGMSSSQLKRLARRHKPVTPEEEAEAHEKRHLSLRMDHHRHVLHLNGLLPQAQGEVVMKSLQRIIEQQPKVPERGVYGSYNQRCADALVEVCSRSVSSDPDADRATVVVHVDAATLSGDDGMAEFESGGSMSQQTAQRLVCDARWQVVVDGPDFAIGAGRMSRTVPPPLAREIKRRDLHCRFPGCQRRAWLAIHHVVPWALGGPTESFNLCLICGTHHHWAHEGGGRIEGDANKQLRFFTKDGRELDVSPPPLRTEARSRLLGEDEQAGVLDHSVEDEAGHLVQDETGAEPPLQLPP
jgi:hypothetical protein